MRDKNKILNLLKQSLQNKEIKKFYIILRNKEKYMIKEIKDLNQFHLDEIMKFSLSSKDEKKFFSKNKEISIEEIKNFFNLENKPYTSRLKTGRLVHFEITKHALRRFILRTIGFYAVFHYRKGRDVSEKIITFSETIIELAKENRLHKEKFFIIENILEYMNNGEPLKKRQINRRKDLLNLKRREKKYEDEKEVLKITSHPFLFVVNTNKGILKTVELYSPSFPYIDFINKKTAEIGEQYKDINKAVFEVLKWGKMFKKPF